MTEDSVAHDLETAMQARADKLAQQYLQQARQTSEQIVQQKKERLRLREQQVVSSAREKAERWYCQHVQANKIRIRKQYDQLSWELIRSTMNTLGERLRALIANENEYLPLLQNLIAQAASHIADKELIAQVNANDLKRFAPRWESIARQAAADKKITLNSVAIKCDGGVLLHNRNNQIQVDNRIEGLLDRFADELYQVISERLFVGLNDGGE